MPPRPRSPRPRPTPSRRPRVAGLAPAAPRPDGPARPSGLADDPETEAIATTRAEPGDREAPRKPDAASPETQVDEERGSGKGHAGTRPVPRPKPGRRPSPPRPTSAEAEETTVADRGSEQAAEPAATTDPADADEARSGGLGAALRRRPVALLAAALVVLTGIAVLAGVQDARLRGTPAATNTALVDVGATAEVASQLSDAIETVYSYDFARLDENENAARAVITEPFATEYGHLFGEVRIRAPEQQVVLSATVTHTAVKEVTGDRAVMVAFVDQHATRAAADPQSQQLAAAIRLTVTGERVDGRWRIAGVTPL